jgi:hypothetical protein
LVDVLVQPVVGDSVHPVGKLVMLSEKMVVWAEAIPARTNSRINGV